MDNHVELILSIFEKINAIPRCSGKEKAISDWLVAWAGEHGCESVRDDRLNVLIRVPGTGALEAAAPVALQGHMDMVCEKSPESTHNFERDAITSVREGDWLTAPGTTLGADNGIAIAIALAIASSDLERPPLELVFTVDEESGLTGAQSLNPDWLMAKRMINIDSEDEGVFTIGCAGGLNSLLRVPITTRSAPADFDYFALIVSGLQGGHSGVDIHLDRANANVLAARVWSHVQKNGEAVLGSVEGGSAHNAIPRDARIVVGTAPGDSTVSAEMERLRDVFRGEYGSTDPHLELSIARVDPPKTVLERESANRVMALLLAMPHGVLRMSREIDGLVETSTNLATVRTKNKEVEIDTSQRSSTLTQLDAIADRIAALADLASAGVKITSRYPPWEPQPESSLLTAALETYQNTFNREPTVEIIHAGLECGVIGSKYPGMEMLSIGPTIEMPHSPDERLFIPSLGQIWEFLVQLLVSLR